MKTMVEHYADWITAIQTPFYPGEYAEPFVTVFLLHGDSMVLFDSGLPWTAEAVLSVLHDTRRHSDDLRLILHSHAHYDHIGGAALLQARSNALIAIHPAGVRWFESHDQQFREFYQGFPDAWQPETKDTRDFYVMIGSEVRAHLAISSSVLRLDATRTLECFPTPGHLASCVTLFDPTERIMLTADAFQGFGFFNNWPQYEDVPAYLQTLAEIERRQPNMLLTAHSAPLTGGEISHAINSAREYVAEIERVILTVVQETKQALSLREIAEKAGSRLGKPYTIQGLITVDAHLRHLATKGAIQRDGAGWKASS